LWAHGVAAAATTCDPGNGEIDKESARQKIDLLLRIAIDSVPAKRVLERGSAEARMLLERAVVDATDAKSAYEQGCFSTAAALAVSGLSTTALAFRSGSVSNAEDANRFRDLQRHVSSLLNAIEQQGGEVSVLDPEEIVGLRRQIDRAEQLALQGQHAAAVPLLAPIADRLERRLIDIYDNKTLVYSKNFASPAEEHAYHVEYYRGCKALLDMQVRDASAIAGFLAVAEESFNGSNALASNSAWDAALEEIRLANERCEQALRIAGVYR
jgi:hypothetical protein